MNELSTSVKTHIIITWSKGEYPITERQHNEVIKLGLNDQITIEGNTLFGKSIAEIITVAEKRRRDNDIKVGSEDTYYKNFTINETLESFTPDRRQKALIKIREGFKKHFKGRQIQSNAQVMLKNMDYRIGTAQW